MADVGDADGAALKAIESAMNLPLGNPVAVLALYRKECELAAREQVLDAVAAFVVREGVRIGGERVVLTTLLARELERLRSAP
jgi:hypothetical protein